MQTSPGFDRSSNLTRTSILRINEPGTSPIRQQSRKDDLIVPSPVVNRIKVPMSRARRTLADEGNSDVVHHVGIISPPPAYVADKIPSPTRVRTTLSTAYSETIKSPDSVNPQKIVIRKSRAKSNIISPVDGDLIDAPLAASHQTLIKDDHQIDPKLRQPVKVSLFNQFRPSFVLINILTMHISI